MPPTTTAPPLVSVADRVAIAPGVEMPRLGLGTSRAHGQAAVDAMLTAFALGYRLIDTSANYGNEEQVGLAIAESEVPREEIFLTTKLEGPNQGGLDRVRPALEGSLLRLHLDFIDLYLIHWPQPSRTAETWQSLEVLQREGLCRSIGVSNFEIRDLEQLLAVATIPPAVNQIKLNPAAQRPQLQEYCERLGIVLEAWEPVLRGEAGSVPLLRELGQRYGKSAEQISLRWLLQKGFIAIPKTVHESRLRENADLYDFGLAEADMAAIAALAEESAR